MNVLYKCTVHALTYFNDTIRRFKRTLKLLILEGRSLERGVVSNNEYVYSVCHHNTYINSNILPGVLASKTKTILSPTVIVDKG